MEVSDGSKIVRANAAHTGEAVRGLTEVRGQTEVSPVPGSPSGGQEAPDDERETVRVRDVLHLSYSTLSLCLPLTFR